jgi:elongation factor P
MVLTYERKPIGVELPTTVEREVVDTEPGYKGDTASGNTKPAKLDTGIVVAVPFFVNQGDRIKVDTRSGEYVERA